MWVGIAIAQYHWRAWGEGRAVEACFPCEYGQVAWLGPGHDEQETTAMTFMVAKKGAVAAILALLMLNFSSEADAQRGDLETVKGTVKGFTEAPKGEIDGMALSDGTVVHWPPHLEKKFTAIVKKGDRVEVVGRRVTLKQGEKLFEARTVTNLTTKASYTRDDDKPLPPKDKKDKDKKDKKDKKDGPPPPKDKKDKERKRVVGPDRTVTGTIERFTAAPKGEIDGMVLSDGTVVHWPPHQERLFTTIVKKGDRVRVVGFDEIKPKGEQVLVVRSVTNLATKMTRVNEDAPSASDGSE
jgi:hypothetical protein